MSSSTATNPAQVLHSKYGAKLFSLGIINVEADPSGDGKKIFTVAIRLKGREYRGKGSTKKHAKQAACKAALRHLAEVERERERDRERDRDRKRADRDRKRLRDRDDERDRHHDRERDRERDRDRERERLSSRSRASTDSARSDFVGRRYPDYNQPQGAAARIQQFLRERGKTPLTLFNELYRRDAEWQDHGAYYRGDTPLYETSVRVGLRQFYGYGGKRQEARHLAALEAIVGLAPLRGDQQSGFAQSNSHSVAAAGKVTEYRTGIRVTYDIDDEDDKTQDLAPSQGVLGQLEVMISSNAVLGSNVVAAVIMTRANTRTEQCRIVAMGTGARIADKDRLLSDGSCLRDCHAMVVTRRAFVRYLYEQIEVCIEQYSPIKESESMDGGESIFHLRSNGVVLKSDVQFHVFLSSVPCGDARMCCLEKQTNMVNSEARAPGQLHYKSLRGTETSASQIKPHRTAGKEHMRVMSCCDKILSWMTLGLQGSLLSTLMPPVYARSYIFGSMFDLDVMEETLMKRAEGLSLPLPFVFNMPKLMGHMQLEPATDLPKASNFSLNWSFGDDALELVEAETGRQVSRDPSRICKQRLFQLYSRTCARLSTISSVQNVPTGLSYRLAKAASKTHQAAKEALLAHLEPRLGYWIRKPHDLDGFSLQKSEEQDEDGQLI